MRQHCHLFTKDGQFLRESGYEEFPGVAPRWEVNDGRVYGDSPAMDALGDNKQLQIQERRKGQGIIADPAGQIQNDLVFAQLHGIEK